MISHIDNYLKRSVLIPLGLALAVLLLVAVYAVDRMDRQHVAEEMRHMRHSAQALFENQLESEAGHLAALLELLARDARLLDALQRRDLAALLAVGEPLYRPLRERHGITHFYFSGPDRINLLRVHEPDRYGDRIDRHTTLQAERSGQNAWGIELGSLGLFTLRVVRPVHVQGRLIGYLELGEEIGHVVQRIARTANLDIQVFIYKRFLDRVKWEAGNKVIGRLAEG